MTRRKIDYFDPSKFFLLTIPDTAVAPSWTDLYVDDPATHQYFLRRLETRKKAFPNDDRLHSDPYWKNDVTIDAADIRPFSVFKCPLPKTVPNYLWIPKDHDAHGYVSIVVVSKEWRDVLEYLEPGKHQFFPHELRFADGSAVSRYVFYHRSRIVAIDFVASKFQEAVTLDGTQHYWLSGPDWTFDDLRLVRSQLEGLHFFVPIPKGGPEEREFYSPAAAAMLQSLLPSRCYFTPIECL